jgi:thiol:disulfide interchange protein DsbA
MRRLIPVISAWLLALLAVACVASESHYEEGVHYHAIKPAQPGGDDGRILVTELFWYGCPHCNELEPLLEKWLETLPEDVDFVRVPVMFSRPFIQMHAEAYYTLEAMGKLAEMHPKIFHAIHEEGRKLNTPQAFEQFLEEQGVDMEAYRKARASFAVQAEVKRAKSLTTRYGIRGVPAMVVDGDYRTSPADAGGYQEALEVTDYLIDRVRTAKGSR